MVRTLKTGTSEDKCTKAGSIGAITNHKTWLHTSFRPWTRWILPITRTSTHLFKSQINRFLVSQEFHSMLIIRLKTCRITNFWMETSIIKYHKLLRNNTEKIYRNLQYFLIERKAQRVINAKAIQICQKNKIYLISSNAILWKIIKSKHRRI